MATMDVGKYRQFFEIDEDYFPCIDDSAIEAGAPWKNTYPHETFIDLLKSVERMLGGSTKRSIWIHGAYGTGKSQCAYALKEILEVSEAELKEYWDMYDPLKNNPDLLQKLLGHKDRKIITAYRYASGGITTPRDLFFAVQECVKHAIETNPLITYQGENTLKESVIAWLEDPSHKNFFNELLKKPEWDSVFAQTDADQVLNSLRKGSDVKGLMDNIFSLADKEGITAMTLDADKLKDWIKDIISKNGTKIVLVWDEFSGFFKQNKNSLDEFQKIVALCEDVPFYFIIVTHQRDSIINEEDQSWSVVRQRFDAVQITLPDNIAFNLIGHAFNVKPAAQETWDICANDLNSRLTDSRREVMKAARITDPKVIKDIMPLHPMAALILKNIASSFQSNQRSMFDFIKTSNTDDVKAFQWFIEQTGPSDDHPLLTIDMLWNFFYEKGRDDLTADIRMILDTFPQQHDLREDEQRVLKTILIMQAIDKRLGGAIELLKPTEQNISYAFEGINSGLDVTCKNLAKGLNTKGILVLNPIGDNKYAYGAAVLAGDQAKIDEYKKTVKQTSTTAKLVAEGKLASTCLSLSPALRLRFADNAADGSLIPVTVADFTRVINGIKDKEITWHFNAVIAFAKDTDEATSLRKMIKEAALNDEYKNIVFVDATETPLGEENLNAYIEYTAMSMYYQGNNNQSSRENAGKATLVLSSTWRNELYTHRFVVYDSSCPEGQIAANGQGVSSILQTIVMKHHKFIFDFSRGLTENQLKLTQAKPAAKCGIVEKTGGVVTNAEKSVLPAVWGVEQYWEKPETSGLEISEIKRSVEKLIAESFDKEGQISIGEIYDLLENEYGFAPSNLSAFITGFLLKEYGGEPYRYCDSSGIHEAMSQDKLSEMIANYIVRRPAPTFIVKMTAEEKSFYETTEKAWGIPENSCSSVSQAGIMVKKKMQSFGLPIWCLEDVDTTGAYEIVKKYIDLVQKEGTEAHRIAIEIGSISLNRPSLADNLKSFLTIENCQNGMRSFIQRFDGGALYNLACDIGAKNTIIKDIGRLFEVENSSLWNSEIGQDQIKTLLYDYTFVKHTRDILGENVTSKGAAFTAWTEKLQFSMCSCEALQNEYPDLSKCFELLLKIYKNEEILPDQMKMYVQDFSQNLDAIKQCFDDEISIFSRIYAAYLEDFEPSDIMQLKTRLVDIFKKSRTEGNAVVKNAADDYRKNLKKTQLFNLWKEKTGTKNPSDWSSKHRTPILLLVDRSEYDDAKKAFETLNRTTSNESDISSALSFLERTNIYGSLDDNSKVDAAFTRMLGSYKSILTDINKVRDALERLPISPYDWYEHPDVKTKVYSLAKAEYDAGGSDRVINRIEKMQNDELKKYLIQLVKDNMKLGAEIMNEGD